MRVRIRCVLVREQMLVCVNKTRMKIRRNDLECKARFYKTDFHFLAIFFFFSKMTLFFFFEIETKAYLELDISLDKFKFGPRSHRLRIH